MDSVSMEDVQSILNNISDATHLKFIANPDYNDASLGLSARISILEVPSERSEFEQSCANKIGRSYNFLSKITTNEVGGIGIPGMIEVVFHNPAYAIAHARGTKDKRTIFDVLIVKPVRLGTAKNIVYRAILEGIGYDADNSIVKDSIFDESFRTDLTERDKAALRQLYSVQTDK